MTKDQITELAVAKENIGKHTKLQELIHRNTAKHLGIKRDSPLDDRLFDYLYNDGSLDELKKEYLFSVS